MGVDPGGTKIEGIVLDANGDELLCHRVLVPAGDYRKTPEAIAGLAGYIETSTEKSGTVGIGTSGAISPTSALLSNSNSTCMNGQPIKADLQALLNPGICMSNDANALRCRKQRMALPVALRLFLVLLLAQAGGLEP